MDLYKGESNSEKEMFDMLLKDDVLFKLRGIVIGHHVVDGKEVDTERHYFTGTFNKGNIKVTNNVNKVLFLKYQLAMYNTMLNTDEKQLLDAIEQLRKENPLA